MYRSQLLTIIFVGLALIVVVNADKEESQKEAGVKRRNSNAMNPYSWRNRVRRGMEDEFLAPDDSVNVQQDVFVPQMMNKRARNPYSWVRFASPDTDQGSFFDTLFGGVKDKKSPYLFNYNDGRRARNPYSWQNYV